MDQTEILYDLFFLANTANKIILKGDTLYFETTRRKRKTIPVPRELDLPQGELECQDIRTINKFIIEKHPGSQDQNTNPFPILPSLAVRTSGNTYFNNTNIVRYLEVTQALIRTRYPGLLESISHLNFTETKTDRLLVEGALDALRPVSKHVALFQKKGVLDKKLLLVGEKHYVMSIQAGRLVYLSLAVIRLSKPESPPALEPSGTGKDAFLELCRAIDESFN